MIDDYKEGVVSLRFGEVGDKIHVDMGERMGIPVGGYWHKRWHGGVIVDFHLLADGASVNVVGDVFLHAWPVVGSLDLFQGVKDAGVCADRNIMMKSEDLFLECVIIGDVELVLEVEEVIVVNVPVIECGPDGREFVFDFLDCVGHKGVMVHGSHDEFRDVVGGR